MTPAPPESEPIVLCSRQEVLASVLTLAGEIDPSHHDAIAGLDAARVRRAAAVCDDLLAARRRFAQAEQRDEDVIDAVLAQSALSHATALLPPSAKKGA